VPAIKKEQIKDQMVRTAARVWGVPDNEIDTNFDPLAMLLIEACAAELEKIGFEINASHTRLLDRLADLVIPEALLGPKPASCIATAGPLETTARVDAMTRFFVPQRIQNNSGSYNLNMFFTPVGEFVLHKARLAYTLIGRKMFKVNGNGTKELVSAEESGSQTMVDEVWLALEPDKGLKSLKGLSVYFDLRSHSKAKLLYTSLGGAKAWLNGEETRMGSGYFDAGQFELNPEEMLVAGHDYLKKINRNIAGNYRNQFLHVADDGGFVAGKAPEELQQSLSKQALQRLGNEPLIFLKIKLSRYFLQEELDGLVCSINAFPLVNRKFNTMNYRTDAWINVVPIQIDGAFLDLNEIRTAGGDNFKFRITADAQNIGEGEAFVRNTGIGKATSKEVREIISSLISAIRDENAYFSELSNDFIMARLKEINQILARLDDQMQKSNDSQAAHHYILLKPKKAGEQVAINYWTTDGALANQVKAGLALTSFNHTLVSPKDSFIISNAVGGKTNISDSERRFLLKQQIISNGRITSAEDVKMLCGQLFGSNLLSVRIEKGVQVGNSGSEGFSRTIDVIMKVKNKESDETQYLCRELMYTLENKATLVYPFRILME
jgi:hypothetical protein